jgi:flagellar L-ring protein precursor FlgH
MMNSTRKTILGVELLLISVGLLAPTAYAQSSSLLRWSAQRPPSATAENQADRGAYGTTTAAPFSAAAPREISAPATHALEMASLIAIPPVPARKFKVHDLITIIVRQQKKYTADGILDNKDKWNIAGKLSDWFHFYPNSPIKNLGSDKLSNGDPGFKFDYDNKYKLESTNDRQDAFSTRIEATVIDVKPNGNMVLEAKLREQHDDEEFTITLTGTCRSEDVTPDNAILSTQVAELVLVEKNTGAVRDATKRGFIPRILDFAKPF